MKRIEFEDELVSFNIPDHWEAEYDEVEGGTFFADDPDTGTLRLMVTSYRLNCEASTTAAGQVLGKIGRPTPLAVDELADGPVLMAYEQDLEEDGEAFVVFGWDIAVPLPPDGLNLVSFAYVVLAERAFDPSEQETVSLLNQEIHNATYRPRLRKNGNGDLLILD